MLYLIDNPVVREAFFPSGRQPMAVEPARPGDADAMRGRSAGRHEGPEAAALAGAVVDVAPDSSRSSATATVSVTGFFALLDGTQMRPPLVRGDPVVAGLECGICATIRCPQGAAGPRAAAVAGRRPRRGAGSVAGRLLAGRQAGLHGAAAGAAPHVRRRPRRRDVLASGRGARLPPDRRVTA